MRIDVLTLFPDMFHALTHSLIGKAQTNEHIQLHTTNIRDFAHNKQRQVDDYPFGGGAGMLLKIEPLVGALESVRQPTVSPRIILLDPAGRPFNQQVAQELAQETHLVFICGHYEGYDARIHNYVTDEISLGDYVLTGGELAAMVMIDATVRLLPEVLGNQLSAQEDSHATGLLEYPQYTRPRVFRDQAVPDILLSGDHAKIAEWRAKEALHKTFIRRPDMLAQYQLSAQEQNWVQEWQKVEPD